MNLTTVSNAALQTVATGLVALGATTIVNDLWAGVIEIVLGLAVYVVYEKFPTS